MSIVRRGLARHRRALVCAKDGIFCEGPGFCMGSWGGFSGTPLKHGRGLLIKLGGAHASGDCHGKGTLLMMQSNVEWYDI